MTTCVALEPSSGARSKLRWEVTERRCASSSGESPVKRIRMPGRRERRRRLSDSQGRRELGDERWLKRF